MRTALVTGCTGQDGAWLSQLLLNKGYSVLGLYRRVANDTFGRLRELDLLDNANFQLVPGDVTDPTGINRLFSDYEIDEVYNLAAQSFVKESFNTPITTSIINGMGPAYILEAIRLFSPQTRFYQAGTSEEFGHADYREPMNEETILHPRSPYGAAKVYAHHITRIYREAYGLFACVGLLFNHESIFRGEEFVTTKVCKGAAEIAHGKRSALQLGNLDARRDWGCAKDYVRAMHLMLQRPEPDDFVIATGESYSIRDLCQVAFEYFNLVWQDHVESDTAHTRPSDVNCLIGDASKAAMLLGWRPNIAFKDMIQEMCEYWDRRMKQ
jgi:GDPmannose 4,6-dehydratase